MKNSPVALVLTLIVGLGAGLAGGALLFGASPNGPADGSSAVAAANSAPAVPSATSDRGPSVATPEVFDPRDGALTLSDEGGLSDQDRSRARSVALEVQRNRAGQMEATIGTGALSGRVETLDGEGLAGVIVRIAPEGTVGPRDPGGALVDRDGRSLEEVLTEAAESALRERRERREVRTDAAGAFRFEGLPDQEWAISGFLEGYAISPASFVQESVPTGTEVLLLAESVQGVVLDVTRSDGSVPEAAVVHAPHSDDRFAESIFYTWTPGTPALQLRPGSYDLRVYADVRSDVLEADTILSEWMSGSVDLHVDRQALGPVPIVLEPTNAIHGMVRFDAAFRPQDNLQLFVQAFTGDEPPESEDLSSDNSSYLRTGGAFVRRELEPGTYVIAVVEGWRGPVIAREVLEFPGGIVGRDLLVARGEDHQEVRLTVTTTGGEPVERTAFRIRRHSKSSTSTRGLSATFRNGAFVFPFPSNRFDPSEDGVVVEVLLDDDRFGAASVELVPGVLEYAMTATEPVSLTVAVTGYGDEETRSRLRVTVDEITDDPEQEGLAFSTNGWIDEQGLFEAEGTLPGRYRLTMLYATERARGWEAFRVAEMDVVVGPGGATATFPMPGLHGLTVRAPDFVDGTRFSLRRSDVERDSALSGGRNVRLEDGVVRFEHVPTGTYVLAVVDYSGQRMTIEVPCGEIAFEGSVPNAAEVVVEDADGILAKIGLATGDLVIAVDGADLGQNGLADRTAGLLWQKSGEHTVTVLRDGRELTLNWSAVELGTLGLGGQVTPVHSDR